MQTIKTERKPLISGKFLESNSLYLILNLPSFSCVKGNEILILVHICDFTGHWWSSEYTSYDEGFYTKVINSLCVVILFNMLSWDFCSGCEPQH